jgi:heme/copper-type cytochrome/quinol oxidase subunit 2
MPIHVKVLSEADYSAWVKTQQTSKTAAAKTEQVVAQANVTK